MYPLYNHNWRNISTIYIYNKTSIKRNILTIKKIHREVGQAKDLSAPLYCKLCALFFPIYVCLLISCPYHDTWRPKCSTFLHKYLHLTFKPVTNKSTDVQHLLYPWCTQRNRRLPGRPLPLTTKRNIKNRFCRHDDTKGFM